jgi:ribonuclease D
MATANTKKITLSISKEFMSKIEVVASSLDSSVNSILKQSALASFNKANLTFLTSEDRLLIQQFQKNQIVLANILKQFQTDALNGEVLPVDKIIKNFHIYHEQFVDMIETVGNKK